jgi:hypothetical protein
MPSGSPGGRHQHRGQPILVTGVPRSGTTWLARLLAGSPGTALAGREPMNPRGRQYALGGTVAGWARLTDLTPRQRRLLRSAYRGWNPWVYSRFGTRQWAGPLPRTRLVVKDPFAMLSLPSVVRATGALPVLVYRHPGAVLASYRRMQWQPDLEELAAIVADVRAGGSGQDLPDLPRRGEASPAEEMGLFWSVLHELALADAERSGVVVVSHSELATGGVVAGSTLAERLGLRWSPAMAEELSNEAPSAPVRTEQLHNFDRAPAAVAEEWRAKLTSLDIERIEAVTERTRARLESDRIALGR